MYHHPASTQGYIKEEIIATILLTDWFSATNNGSSHLFSHLILNDNSVRKQSNYGPGLYFIDQDTEGSDLFKCVSNKGWF